MKKILSNTIEIFILAFFFILAIMLWPEIRLLGITLLILLAPLSLYEAYEFFRKMHQNNLDDIQEQLNIVQDSWIEDISNKVRENWDLKTNKVIPYDRWNCRIYIQQD